MDKMTWAKFHPKKTRMADSIPRPDGDTNSKVIKKDTITSITQKSFYPYFFRLTKRWWISVPTHIMLSFSGFQIEELKMDIGRIAGQMMVWRRNLLISMTLLRMSTKWQQHICLKSL